MEPGDVLAVIDGLEDSLRGQIERMERVARLPQIDDFDSHRTAILGGLKEHLESLESVRRFFETKDTGLLNEAFLGLQEASRRMVSGYEGLLRQDTLFTPKLCLQCSAENPKGAYSCENCDAALPALEFLGEGQPFSDLNF